MSHRPASAMFSGGCSTLAGVSGSSWEGILVLGVGHAGALGNFMGRGGNDV